MSNPLVDLWKNEMTGMALAAIRMAWIHDEAMAVDLAIQAVERGADEVEVLKLLESLRAVPSNTDGET